MLIVLLERNLGMECRLYELRNGRRTRCRSLQAARKRHEFVPWIRSSMGTMITGGTRLARSSTTSTMMVHASRASTFRQWFYLRLRCLDNYCAGLGQTKKPLTWANARFTTRRIVMPRLSINLYHVTKDGWKKIHAIDVNEMHYEFVEEKKNAMAP
jgi:20S proteasome subunit beta 5